MSNTADLIINRLREAFQQHGAVAEFCRKSGLPRRTVDNWMAKRSYPGLDSLDAIAKGLDLQPWELLKPPTTSQLQEAGPKLVDPDASRLAALGSIVARISTFNEDELRFIEPPIGLVEDTRRAVQTEKLQKNKV